MAAHYLKAKNNENAEAISAEFLKDQKPTNYALMIRKARKFLRLIDAALALFNSRN